MGSVEYDRFLLFRSSGPQTRDWGGPYGPSARRVPTLAAHAQRKRYVMLPDPKLFLSTPNERESGKGS